MPPTLLETLPLPLRSIVTRPLLVMRLQVRPLSIVGQTPGAFRRIGVVPGGHFDGDRLRGEILDGGSDWQTVRTDGSTSLDVRLVLRTDDGALITMSYRGLRSGPPDVIAKIDTARRSTRTAITFASRRCSSVRPSATTGSTA